MKTFSHLDVTGAATMVDVGLKPPQLRRAVATGELRCAPATIRLLKKQALPKGDVLACARLARVYIEDIVQPPEWSKGLAAATKACDLHDPWACQAAATLVAEGKGTVPDADHAARLRARACSLGAAEACPPPPPD